MKTSGLFSTHRVEVEVELGKPFKLIPFGDVHRDSPQHSLTHWKEFLAYAKTQKNALFLGMGDMTDGVSTSERIILSDAHLHESTKSTLAGVYTGVVKTLEKELSFMKGRLIGLLGGNHYYQFDNGDTTDHVLAALLQTKFLGVCSFIRLSLRFKNKKSLRHSIDIFAHHGVGGGTLPGSTFNTIEKMQNTADAEIYCMGHDHKRGVIPSHPRLKLVTAGPSGELCVRERTPWLGRTGSFLKAYEPGTVSYNVDAARAACSLGWIEFEITPVRRQKSNGNHKFDFIEMQIRGTA